MEKGLEEGREKGLEEGREKGMIEGREEGVQLAFEMLLLLMQDIKSANFSNNELCIKYNVPESYIQQLVSLAN
jgi:hypothetical protein